MSAKLVPTFADRGCRVVSATDPHGFILGFLDRFGKDCKVKLKLNVKKKLCLKEIKIKYA
jgi:hypothetical protein